MIRFNYIAGNTRLLEGIRINNTNFFSSVSHSIYLILMRETKASPAVIVYYDFSYDNSSMLCK